MRNYTMRGFCKKEEAIIIREPAVRDMRMALRMLSLALPLILLRLNLVQCGVTSLESFPSCVEITAVSPPPYSVARVTENLNVLFDIDFSKPVKRISKKCVGLFLSTLPRRYKGPGVKPTVTRDKGSRIEGTGGSNGSSYRWSASVSIKGQRGQPLFRKFYLIVDGAFFYTFDASGRRIFAPYTVLGPYYIDKLEREYYGNPAIRPIVPTPYCRPRKAPITHPTSFYHDDQGRYLYAEIPRSGHRMNPKKTNMVKLLALVNVTEGSGTIRLPKQVTVSIGGVEYDVRLPSWNLTFNLPRTSLLIHANQKMILEPYEHIYHSLTPAYVVVNWLLAPHIKDRAHTYGHPQPYRLDKERGDQEGVEVFAWPNGPKLLEFQKKKRVWFERVRTGHYHKNFPGSPNPDSRSVISRVFETTYKQCPAGSRRSSGRQGHIYHVIDYGAFHQMLEIPPLKMWSIRHSRMKSFRRSKMIVMATTSRGKRKDLSNKAKFGWNGKKISSRVVKALTQDYVCLQKRNTFNSETCINLLNECTYVPKKVAYSKECGGLQLHKNLTTILKVKNFCNRDFGHCIGKGYHSLERFPVIPPYGLPELRGKVNIKSSNKKVNVEFSGEFNTLYQLDIHNIPITGAKLLLPRVRFRSHFCKGVWKLQSEHAVPSAYLSAHIKNSGNGGGLFDVRVNCSSNIPVSPSNLISVRIPQKSSKVVRFRLSGRDVIHKRKARHNCRMKITIRTAKELASRVQTFPKCSKRITTHHGYFRDPCKLKAKRLPNVDMKYYNLPMLQMEPLVRNMAVQKRASFTGERVLHLVKAITVSLGVEVEDQHLIGNLKQLHVYCGRKDILLTRTYGEFLVLQAVKGLTDVPQSKPSLVFSGDDINTNTIYFFMSQDLTPIYSDCWAEVWANRPHPLCDNPFLVAYAAIPLRDHDQAVLAGKKSRFSMVYGTTSEGVQKLLLMCIAVGIVFGILGCLVNCCLLLCRKKLPQIDTLKKHKKELIKLQQEDEDYWENPVMFLIHGEHGPYYKLHSFKATDALDSENIKSLKLAGCLRYKTKELQVLFGHIKKVYIDKTTKAVWIQASSGMYEMTPDQVDVEYRENYTILMEAYGIEMIPEDFEPIVPESSYEEEEEEEVLYEEEEEVLYEDEEEEVLYEAEEEEVLHKEEKEVLYEEEKEEVLYEADKVVLYEEEKEEEEQKKEIEEEEQKEDLEY